MKCPATNCNEDMDLVEVVKTGALYACTCNDCKNCGIVIFIPEH